MGDKTLPMPQISIHIRVSPGSIAGQNPTELNDEIRLDEQIPNISVGQEPTEDSANDGAKDEDKTDVATEMEGLVGFARRLLRVYRSIIHCSSVIRFSHRSAIQSKTRKGRHFQSTLASSTQTTY